MFFYLFQNIPQPHLFGLFKMLKKYFGCFSISFKIPKSHFFGLCEMVKKYFGCFSNSFKTWRTFMFKIFQTHLFGLCKMVKRYGCFSISFFFFSRLLADFIPQFRIFFLFCGWHIWTQRLSKFPRSLFCSIKWISRVPSVSVSWIDKPAIRRMYCLFLQCRAVHVRWHFLVCYSILVYFIIALRGTTDIQPRLGKPAWD